MKRALFASLCLSFAFACTSSSGGGDTDGETSDSDSDSDSDTDDTNGDGDGDDSDTDATDTLPTTDTDDTGPLEPVASVVGVIHDESGAPLPSPGLQFCGPVPDEGFGIAELCISFDVDPDDGSFVIDAPKVGIWSLKVVHGDTEGGRKFGGQAFQLTIEDGDAIDLSDNPIVVPEVSAVTALDEAGGEQAVSIEGGLTVMIDPAEAKTTSFAPPTELGGRMVDPAHWRYSDIAGETMVAAWSFAPFGTKSNDGVTFGMAIEDGLGLEAGSSVKVYELEKDNGALHHIGDGTVNGDASGIDVTSAGDGFHELSWVIVTQ